MRRLTRLLLVLLGTALSAGNVPARAAEQGVIAGVVVNESTGRPQPGVRVTLTGGKEDGSARLERVDVTDRRGRYRFGSLPTGKDRIYSIDAVHSGGLFAGRAMSLPADTPRAPVVQTRLRVWNTTTDPTAILVRRSDVFVLEREGEVGVVEGAVVINQTKLAYIGRGARRTEEPGASLGFPLPAGARKQGLAILDSTLDMPRLVATDFGFATTAAIPPGETRTTFSYSLQGAGGSFDLSRTALYPTVELSVFAERPFEVKGNRLRSDGEVEVGGTRYRKWSTPRALDAGDAVQVLAVAEAGLAPGLLAGLGAGLALLAGLTALAARRRRRARSASRREAERSREELLVEIAKLDLEYRAGDLEQADWGERRAELKERLERLERRPSEPEAVP